MTTLDELRDIARDNDISLVDAHFSASKKAASLMWETDSYILIDMPQVASTAEETVLFSEELGHHMTGSLFMLSAAANSPEARAVQRRNEARARRWSIRQTIPYAELLACLKQGMAVWEIADFFGVTEEHIDKAYHYYKNTCGLSFAG